MARPYLTTALVASIIAISPAIPATLQGLQGQSPVTTTVELNALSDYFFAGIPFATGAVSQARVTVAAPGGLTLNAFSVYDYDAGDITELDVYGDYYRQVAPALGLFVGAALYNFDLATGWEGTPEVYGGVVLTALLNPTVYVAHDFDLGDGTHATLMLSESVPVGASGISLDLAGNVDYNDGYYVDFAGFAYADVGASLGIPAGPVIIRPSFTLLLGLDDAFQLQAGIDDTEAIFGVSASATF